LEKRFLDIKELAEYLGIAINTLRSWVWKREIPCHKFGRLVRFDLREIESWVKDRKVE